jgi:branched-chain amino acid transport system substrate-binding protein
MRTVRQGAVQYLRFERLLLSKGRVTGLLLAALFLFGVTPAHAQVPSQPYARIDRNAVAYNGPGRDSRYDLQGAEIRLGFIAPLTGPHRGTGEALRQAAQMAVDDENRRPFLEGQKLSLQARDENGMWGRVSNAVVNLVLEERAAAIITTFNGAAAHLAEQISTKIGVPILTLASDKTTTEINLPWVFRIGSTDEQQVAAMARDIFVTRGLHHAVLVTEDEHDGRNARSEFERASKDLNLLGMTEVLLGAEDDATSHAVQRILAAAPEALVLWADPEKAAAIVPRIRATHPSLPIYLSRKSAQPPFLELLQPTCHACAGSGAGDDLQIWMPRDADTLEAPWQDFATRYEMVAGRPATPAAAQVYDAVRVFAEGLRRAGPNRVRLRDALAATTNFQGASGVISFDHAGNDTEGVRLARVE